MCSSTTIVVLSLVTNLQFCARASSFWTICVCSKLSPWWWAQWWTVPKPPWKEKHTKPYSNEQLKIESRVVTNDQKTSIYKATRLMYVFIDLLHNDTDNYFVSRSRMFHSYWHVTILLAKEMIGAYCVWAGRDLYRARPAVTRDLIVYGLVWRTAPFSRFLRQVRDYKPDPHWPINVGRKTTCSYGSLTWPPPLDMKYIIFWVVFFWLNEYSIHYFLQNDI